MHSRCLLALTLSTAFLTACATGEYDHEQDPYKDPQLAYASGASETDMSNRASILDGVFERMRAGERSEDSERMAELEAAVRQLEQERDQQQTFEGLRFSVGLLVEADVPNQADAAFHRAADNQPALISGNSRTRQMLTDADCDTQDLTTCAGALAVYPGLRLIIQLSVNEGGMARWRTTDTVLGWQSREQELQLPLSSDGTIPDIALESLAHRALRNALERTRAAPWQTRVFNEADLAINAGRAHGLNAGDTLMVTTPGRVLRGPAGQPAGWLAGETVGRVEVDSLAGERIATVRVLEGERPGPEHILIKE